MTRYLITGAGGMLGRELAGVLADRDVTLATRSDLDITDADAVDAYVAGFDVILNAAAHTKVDDAETHEDEAFAINATGAGNLARAAARHGATIVHVSTDYVFDGTATTPYGENDDVAPVSAYGRTKAEGERQVQDAGAQRWYIVRTAWVYGAGGPNFAKTMVKLATDRDTVSVVNDQIGQPTWTRDLATRLVELADSDAPSGIYHGTNSGQGSWFDFARAVLDSAGMDPEKIQPTDSASFVRPAPRPAYSVLGHDGWAAAGFAPLRDWREALSEASAAGATTP